MSLWYGSCRTEIFDGFGILYQLERNAAGVRRPTAEYVPPNSAVCDACWQKVPDDALKMGPPIDADIVYAYAPADSPSSPFWGSKTWSGIETNDEQLRFISDRTIKRLFPRAVEIIDSMTRRE